ncbi:hypothetical protein [Flavobacterium sp.]|uniref:hypothetical protein n=1 Tax=Flavobacterium sp. TaxID=239 RepID=UPI0025E2C085|nr:hypothetical protein [Flavobacterium sp.]
MSATTFKISTNHFTPETTEAFLNEHEAACQTMDAQTFTNLFKKYDLSFIEDAEKVLKDILDTMNSWKNPKLGTVLFEVSEFDSQCIFCEFGKKVKGYKWTYNNPLDEGVKRILIYQNKIGFRFEIKDGILVEYGTCNAYR